MPPIPVYINGLGIISPQKTYEPATFLDEVIPVVSNQLRCQEPVYKDYISGDLVRRMSRLIKMGIASSRICLQDAGCVMPDAIITGTGLGCIEDTEKFLSAMINNKEEFLTPTPFIQSTHNTVGAQIALLLKCHHYNFTYVHRGHSFESALFDASLQLDTTDAKNILVGGLDELTANLFQITKRLGHWKTKPVNNLQLLNTKTRGSIAGEGSAFFLLSNMQTDRSYAKLSGLSMLLKPSTPDEFFLKVTGLLEKNDLKLENIDLILLGLNGDEKMDRVYDDLISAAAGMSDMAYFKHLSGEYQTASAFGLWLASRVLKSQRIPEVIRLSGSFNRPVKNILLYNHYRNLNHSLMLLSKLN